MPAVKRFERIKKVFGNWIRFDVKPKIKFIPDIPGWDGIALARESWIEDNNLQTGFKMGDLFKEVVIVCPRRLEGMLGDADLLIQESGNKWDANIEQAERETAYDPTHLPYKRYKKTLVRYMEDEGE